MNESFKRPYSGYKTNYSSPKLFVNNQTPNFGKSRGYDIYNFDQSNRVAIFMYDSLFLQLIYDW